MMSAADRLAVLRVVTVAVALSTAFAVAGIARVVLAAAS